MCLCGWCLRFKKMALSEYLHLSHQPNICDQQAEAEVWDEEKEEVCFFDEALIYYLYLQNPSPLLSWLAPELTI